MFSLLLAIIYLAFISLGLPDALLGSAWPSMYGELGVPVSYMGIISMIISLGTIVSSLQTNRLTRRFGTGWVTAGSVALTAAALFGFSVTHSFLGLCLWAIPYGLGAGSVDAALNNYVALHYASRHMSWLHCMWGIGATAGPSVMGMALAGGGGWNGGYRSIAILQMVLTILLLFSLPLWKRRRSPAGEDQGIGPAAGRTQENSNPAPANPVSARQDQALSLREVLRLSGAKEILVCFFCYCAVEQTAGQWASSYLSLCRGVAPEIAAGFASMFFLGITLGRGICGFLTFRLGDVQMIRLGQGIAGLGVLVMLLPSIPAVALAGFVLVGLGCAPIYPSLLHATPSHFGAERSQAIMGVQMASAYVGTCLMPPVFGLLANHVSAALLPVYLLLLLFLMIVMHRVAIGKTRGRK